VLNNVNVTSTDPVWAAVQAIPRRILAEYPTPLLPMKRLSRMLGNVDIRFKRDDLISFGLGGNKVRGLEFLIADALSKGSDTLVTGAGVQSNHVRATAATAACYGLRCIAVFWGQPPTRVDGNYRVTRLLGAETLFTGSNDRTSVDVGINEVCRDLLRKNRHPYAIPRGGACPLGVLGHVLAAQELWLQCNQNNFSPEVVAMATGSGGTQAGWLLGTRLLGAEWTVSGYTVSREAADIRHEVARLATAAAELIEVETHFSCEDADVHDGFIGAGYGVPSREGTEAIRLVARAEGVLLDPTYTGKAMAGLLEHLRNGIVPTRSVVFIHTGGQPAFFAGDDAWLAATRS
jgi:D-cysteine desulfhydrase family pyridoxal phosphate-dependent enzyme